MSRSFEVDVNPNIIKWARESAGWSIEEIAGKLKTSVENYKRIESGLKRPTYRPCPDFETANKKAPAAGLEPATYGLTAHRSTC